MNSSAWQQIIGNVCVGIAAVLYALPLQHVPWELSRKRGDGDDISAPNDLSSDRRKQSLQWGRKTFPAIAERLSAMGVDCKPTFAALEHTLCPDDTCRR